MYSILTEDEADEGEQADTELSEASYNDQAGESESDDRQTVLEQEPEITETQKKSSSLLAAAASTWRAAADMGDSSNPKVVVHFNENLLSYTYNFIAFRPEI